MMIWQDRNMSECFNVFSRVLKVFYVKLYVHSLVDKLNDTACSLPLQRTARWRSPTVYSITPNNIGQTSSTCVIAMVFKLHSSELWGSAADFQGFRQCISFITKWANAVFIVLKSFYFLIQFWSSSELGLFSEQNKRNNMFIVRFKHFISLKFMPFLISMPKN